MSEQDDTTLEPALPVAEDIMQLARLGEIGAIQKLFDSGKCDARYQDAQGVTPLHVSLERTFCVEEHKTD